MLTRNKWPEFSGMRGLLRLKDPVALFTEFDLENHNYIYTFVGLELFLIVLSISKSEIGVDELTASEISAICTEKLKKSEGVHRSTVSSILRKAGSMVDRIENPRGRGYAYRLMPVGEDFLKDVMIRRSYR
jgi:hypothetical protein